MPRYFATIFLSLVAVSGGRADWINYTVAVSNSPSGPFVPKVNLWTQGPLTVDLTAASGPLDVFDGNAYVSLGNLIANFGKSDELPAVFPRMPFAFRINGKLTISGQLNVLSNGDINFADGTASDKSLDITLGSSMQGGPAEPPNMPPGWTPYNVVDANIIAVVPFGEIAQAPEPSTLVLAAMGVMIFGAVRRKVF